VCARRLGRLRRFAGWRLLAQLWNRRYFSACARHGVPSQKGAKLKVPLPILLVDPVISEVFVAGHLTRKELKSDKLLSRRTDCRLCTSASTTADSRRHRGGRAGGDCWRRDLLPGQQHGTRDARLAEAMKSRRLQSARPAHQTHCRSLPWTPKLPRKPRYSPSYWRIIRVRMRATSPNTILPESGISSQAGRSRKKYQEVADHANKNTASLAKFALAQIASQENKSPEAEGLLKDLIDHPTDLVSADQATITLAEVIKTKNPAEARKLLDPLVKEPAKSPHRQPDSQRNSEVTAAGAPMLAHLRFPLAQSRAAGIPSRPILIAAPFSATATASCMPARSPPGKQDQVFSPGVSDHFRNRLTHTIEVSQIARRWRVCWRSMRIWWRRWRWCTTSVIRRLPMPARTN